MRAWIAAVVLAISQTAVADEMPAHMKEALRWIELNSDYRNLAPPRSYSVVSNEEMRRHAMNLASASGANAMYTCASQHVWLRDAFNPKQIYDQSVLVHELTHHAQCVTGRAASNPCEKEREAYELQYKYLMQKATENRDKLPELRKRFDDIVDRHCRR
jgi:hypothetical protein